MELLVIWKYFLFTIFIIFYGDSTEGAVFLTGREDLGTSKDGESKGNHRSVSGGGPKDEEAQLEELKTSSAIHQIIENSTQESPRTWIHKGFDSVASSHVNQSSFLENFSSFNDSEVSEKNFCPSKLSQDVAQYVFWTGDERGVAWTINDFFRDGLFSRDEAVGFLEEVQFQIDTLRRRFGNSPGPLTSSQGTERHAWLKENLRRAWNDDEGIGFSSQSKSTDFPSSLLTLIGSVDHKFREYGLEEIIYQLAKELFLSTLLSKNENTLNAEASTVHPIQKFSQFIEEQRSNGKLPDDLHKAVLDALVAALVDAMTETGSRKY